MLLLSCSARAPKYVWYVGTYCTSSFRYISFVDRYKIRYKISRKYLSTYLSTYGIFEICESCLVSTLGAAFLHKMKMT